MPADFDRCVKNGGRIRTKKLSGGRHMRICFLDGKSFAGEVKKTKGESMNKPMLMYARPILTEAIMKNGERKLFIKGNAIEAGVSRNNVDYKAEVLEVAAKSIIGTPLLLNHGDMDVKNIVGKVVEAGFDGNNMPFKAEIDTNEKWLVNKLEKGFIDKVSIGALPMKNGKVYDPEPDDDGIIRPEGLEFQELSLVPIPGVPNASINQVIAESYKVKKMEKTKIEQLEEKLKKMTETNEALEKKLSEEETSEDKPAEQDEPKEDEKPEPTPDPEPAKEEVTELRKQVEKLTESVSKLTEKPKGVVETEESKMAEKFGFNRGEVSIAHIEGQPSGISEIFTADSTVENDDPTSIRKWRLY